MWQFIFSLLSCSSTRFPNSGTVHVPDDCFGIVHSSMYDIMEEMGAVWTLRTFYWSSIEREKGRFDFSGYDTYVDEAKREGKKVVAVMAYQTDWIFPEGKSKKYILPAYIPDFLNFIEETVKHFQGRVDVWNRIVRHVFTRFALYSRFSEKGKCSFFHCFRLFLRR